MSITTYSELKAAVADWLARDDLTAQIPDFIVGAESWFNHGLRHPAYPLPTLRTRQMEVAATATITAAATPLPTDYLEMILLRLNTDPYSPLGYVTPENLVGLYGSQAARKPKVFTIIGDELRFALPPDSSYTAEMWYYGAIPALSDSNTSNWLLAAHPLLYVHAALMSAAMFARDMTGLVPNLHTLASAEMMALNDSSRAGKRGGTPTMRSNVYGG